MSNELSEYVKLLLSPDNPVYYAILFILLLFLLLYIIFKHVIFPRQKKFLLEKQSLELRNMRLMALFAELDPDPVIRIDEKGEIIYVNDSCRPLVHDGIIEGMQITDLIPQIDFPIMYYIQHDISKNLTQVINEKYYSILFRGISSLNIAQIYFHDVTDKIEYEKRLRYLSENLRNMLEEDRQRIGRELHDGVGHNLLIMKMNFINSYQSILEKEGMDVNSKEYVNFLQKTIDELRTIIFNLKPPTLEEMGLGHALALLVNRTSEESTIKGGIKILGFDGRIGQKLEITIYRIVQEALNNVVKHSKANEFSVQLLKKNGAIKLMIFDDGVGFPKENERVNYGFGLLNIAERVESLNGSFKIDNMIGGGTLLIAELPMKGDNGVN